MARSSTLHPSASWFPSCTNPPPCNKCCNFGHGLEQCLCVRNGYDEDARTFYPVLVIGAGGTGLAPGCQLKCRFGFDQFRIFDRQSRIGGTWRINRYPGVACDVPLAFYSFSFEPFYTSQGLYPTGREFFDYLHRVAIKYKLLDKIQLNVDVSALRYVAADEEWEVALAYLAPGLSDLSERQRQAYVTRYGTRPNLFTGPF